VEAAFFDLDKTVIARASMVAFGPSLYREGLISRTTVLRAVYGQLVYMHLGANEEKLAKIRDSVLALTRGWDRDQIREIVKDTLETVVEPISYAEALEEIELHRRAGRRIYLVSASPEEIVAPLAAHLGTDGAIASRPRVDEEGRYTGEMAFYAYGPYKVEAMKELAEQEGLDLAASWAYSDSYTDLPMLEAVGHPVVVNPDRVLGKLAKERDWDVRTWERTVRLATRRRPPGGAPGLAAAAAAMALAGAGVWWRLSRPAGAPVTAPAGGLGRIRRPAGLAPRLPARVGAAWPWPGTRSGGSAPG
jgi:HAD superfamily hydrolase (TIGR01490 family)